MVKFSPPMNGIVFPGQYFCVSSSINPYSMETEFKIPPKGASLKVFVRPLVPSEQSRLLVFSISKRKSGPHYGLTLPERKELSAVGWIQDIDVQLGDFDSVEMTLSPKAGIIAAATTTDTEGHAPDTVSLHKKDNPIFELPLKHNDEHVHQNKASDTIYEVTFNRREIKINGILLSKVRFDSENDTVFTYIFNNPNRKLTIAEIESATRQPVRKRLSDIVRDLGFTGELKQWFFHDVSKTALIFKPKVTRSEFAKQSIPQIRIQK